MARDFRTIDAWRKADDLAVLVYKDVAATLIGHIRYIESLLEKGQKYT